MTRSFLIRFFERPARKPISAAIIDVPISDRTLRKKVVARRGNPECPHCRGLAATGNTLDRAYELDLVPPGETEFAVFDVSGDPRVTDSDKHVSLSVDSYIDALLAPASVH